MAQIGTIQYKRELEYLWSRMVVSGRRLYQIAAAVELHGYLRVRKIVTKCAKVCHSDL